MSNYPAGVSDNHPYFNPKETSAAVECGADEAFVVPVHVIREGLAEIAKLLEYQPYRPVEIGKVENAVNALRAKIEVLQQEREYECPFIGDMDLEESECARWDCPVCGNERETDTIPEERDPDEAWDRRGDDD